MAAQTKSLIPLFDIDWTLLVGKNQVHLDAFTHMFTTVFNQPTAAISDIVPHGMIDSQIIVEVLKVHGITEAESSQKLTEAFDAINSYYQEHADPKYIEKLPGVDQLLSQLQAKSVLMGLLSGNIEQMAWNKMNVASIRDYFKFGAFGDMARKRADLVGVAIAQIEDKFGLVVKPENMVIIGDSPLDVATAKIAGTRSIAVATGSSSTDVLSQQNPDIVIANFADDIDKVVEFITSPTKI